MKQITRDAGLGTLLRHLVELLDGDVEAVYREQGLDCRSRFTPIIRHLGRDGPSSIRQIAIASGLSHSAISQTVAEMLKKGLVESAHGSDARERIISFTPAGQALCPQLQRLWGGVWAAADELSEDVGGSLPEMLRKTIAAAADRPFRDRIKSHLNSECAAGDAGTASEANIVAW